ncbi:MAG: SIR2 family protein [Verrucomicrobiales bacterium]
MVGDLTNQVLESAWQTHTDWRFYPIPEDEATSSTGLAAKAQHLIRLIHEQIKGHLAHREGRHPNYEDHFACLKQIVQDETREIVNPLISGSVQQLKDAAASLYLPISAHIDDNRFASLAERASDLIQCIVFHALRGVGAPVGLDLFTDAAKRFPQVDIFSLNHDLLIESQFESQNMPYADGFGEPDGDATLFSWSWNEDAPGVRLFKLHGSVDWYLFRFGSRGVDQYAKLRKDPDHAKDSNGDWISALEIVPSFLTGTTVKEQAYGYSLYGELFEQFRHRVRAHRTLVFSGYGWGDKGINIRLNQWLRDRRENRIVILHGSGEADVRQKRFWYWKWDDYHKAGKVKVVPKWFSDCTAEELGQLVQI